MVGPTRLGKTEWARSLGHHMYYCNMFDLSSWDQSAEYIIFDDIDFDFMTAAKAFWGAQREFSLTDRYRKKKTVQFGKPLIFLCNADQDPQFKKHWNQWYIDNCIRVEVTNKFY